MSIERVAPEQITVSTSRTALRITQEGTGHAFVVEDSSNPDSTPFIIDNQGRVGIKKTPSLDLDVNGNISASNVISGYQVTTTSSSTTTLTATSAQQQFFIGSQPEDVVLPVVSTLVLGQYFTIHNNTNAALSIKSSGSNLVHTLPPQSTSQYTCIALTGTTESSWDVDTVGQSAYETTVTSNGTTTLDISSAERQYFTGISNQTIVLPVASTLSVGEYFEVTNSSTGTLTVVSSGLNTVTLVDSGSTVRITCISTSGTGSSSWESRFTGNSTITGTGSMVLSASPALTGVPVAPTASAGTNTTQIATTAFVATALSDLVGSSPELLNTLEELALALGEDANFATTVTDALALKAPLDSPALTGTPTAPTAAVDTNTTQIATTAFVKAQIADDAVLNTGDSMTGALDITVNSAGNAFAVSQSGAGNVVDLRGNGSVSPFIIDSLGRVLINNTSSTDFDGLTEVALQVYGEVVGHSSIAQLYSADGTAGARHLFAKSRGTVASPTIVSNGDFLGEIKFNAFDGDDYSVTGAGIYAGVDGTPASNFIPGYLSLRTNPGSAVTERVRIHPSGNVGINNTDNNAQLTVEAPNQGTALALSSPVNATNAGSKIAFFAANRTDTNEEMAAIVPLLVNNNGGTGNVQRGHLTFRTTNAERLRISETGNVAIGTTTTSYKFVVEDDIDGSLVTQFRNPNTGTSTTTLIQLQTGGDRYINLKVQYASQYFQINGANIPTSYFDFDTQIFRDSSGSEYMRLNTNGLGIGKTPSTKLDVYSTVGGTTAVIENAHSLGLGDGLRVVSARENLNQSADYTCSLIKTVYDTDNNGTGEASYAYIHLNNGVNANTGTATFWVKADGSAYFASSVGIGATPSGTYDLEVNGSFAATTKSFDIVHPTKEGQRLQHGSLEGPENGVYVRGRGTVGSPVELPDYWTGLVHEDSITVQVTPIGTPETLYVADISDNTVTIGGSEEGIEFFYLIHAERKDVDKLVVEYAN